MKLLLTITMVILCANTSMATKYQRMIIHMNGYKGNLSWKLNPDDNNPDPPRYYFYVYDTKGDTIVDVPGTSSGIYTIDIGAYVAGSEFGVAVVDGKFVFTNNEKADMRVIKDIHGKDSIPVLTLKTCKVNINKSGLKLPYMLSAFALIPGNTTTYGSQYRFIANDTTVTLIKGATYTIDNGSFSLSSSFSFGVTKDGYIAGEYAGAASAMANTLVFKTETITADPYLATGKKNMKLRFAYAKMGYIVAKPERFRIIRNLEITYSWDDAGEHASYYKLP